MFSEELILSRDSYLLAMELRIFWSVALIYSLSFVFFIFHAVTGRVSPGRAGRLAMLAGAVAHLGLIALRTFEAGRAPFQTLYESLSWFSCSAALIFLFVSIRWKRIYLPGLFVSALSAGALFYALVYRSPAIEPLSPPLQSYWYEWHVILAFFSYAVFAVSASVEAVYLIARPLVGTKKKVYGLDTENIKAFHGTAFKLVVFGFPFFTFAIFSGAVWASGAWGRYWSWDTKETLSLAAWTVYAAYLHSKTIPGLDGLAASTLNLFGFACMAMTFLGVDWLAGLLGVPSLRIYSI